MKKIFLILITILFTSNVFADHDKYKCSKKESILYGADKVLKRGAHVGGNHGDEYMPQFINFFKKNLL